MLIFQPVDVVCLRTIRVDILAPAVIRMCADAVDRDDTGAKLSASVGREGKKSLGVVLRRGFWVGVCGVRGSLVEDFESNVIVRHRSHLRLISCNLPGP